VTHTITKERMKREATASLSFRALEEAKNAVVTLRALKPMLSRQDEETLSLMIDKKLMGSLEKSLREAHTGKLEPLSLILK